MSTTDAPTLASVTQLIRDNVDTVAPVLAALMANLGGRREWSMEDNFHTTERIAELAGQITGHSAGHMSDDDLRYWHPVAIEAGFDPDEIEDDDETEECADGCGLDVTHDGPCRERPHGRFV